MGLQNFKPEVWNPRQAQSGGTTNGMYSSQIARRPQQSLQGSIPNIGRPTFGGMSRFANSYGTPGGPQPMNPTGTSTTPKPQGPAQLSWAPNVPMEYANANSFFEGFDPGNYAPGTTLGQLLTSGVLTPEQLRAQYGAYDQIDMDAYNQHVASPWYAGETPEEWNMKYGILGSNIQGIVPQQGYEQEFANVLGNPALRTDPTSGYTLGNRMSPYGSATFSLSPSNRSTGYYSGSVGGSSPTGGSYMPGGSYTPSGTAYGGPQQFNDPVMSFMSQFGNLSGGGSSVQAPGINKLSSSLLNGDIFSVPNSSGDYRDLRGNLQNYLLGNIGQIGSGGNVPLPGATTVGNSGVNIASIDTLGGANSPFFQNMMAQYAPAFQAERARAIAEAKEASGNLVGSGYANTVGNSINRTLESQQARIADLVSNQIANEQNRQTQLAQFAQQRNLTQAQLDQQRNLGIYDTQSRLGDSQANRFSSLLGQLGSVGVSPDEIVAQGGLGALIGPLLGALGNSSLGAGLASGLGGLGSGLIEALGGLGGGLASGLGSLAGGLGSLGGSFLEGLGNLGQGIWNSGIGDAIGGAAGSLWEGVKGVLGSLGDKIDIGGLIASIGNIPGIDQILQGIKSGVGGVNLSGVVDAIKKIPGLSGLQIGDIYNVVQQMAKYGIIRGTGGQILNGLPSAGGGAWNPPTPSGGYFGGGYGGGTYGPTYGGPGRRYY